MEYEKFYARIMKFGDSLGIILPSNYFKYGGYKDGDTITVMAKRTEVGDFEVKINDL